MNSLLASNIPREESLAILPDMSNPEAHRNMEMLPCSPSQKSLWLTDRIHPGSPALNISARWTVQGAVPSSVMQAAFAELLRRHTSLRAFFVEQDGEPLQAADPMAAVRVHDIDLSGHSEKEASAEIENIALIDSRTPFDLSDAPLIRVKHLRVLDTESIVLVTVHNLICDEVSMGLLAREFGELCDAILQRGQPDTTDSPLMPLRCNTGAAVSPNDRKGGPDEDFWIRSLQGMSYFEMRPDHRIVTDQPRSLRVVSVSLDRRLKEELEELSHRLCCASSTTVMAVLISMLHRYTGEKDIVIGYQLADRDNVQQRAAVGPFTKTILMRGDLSDDPAIESFVDRMGEVVASAMVHQDVSLNRLAELLNPARDASRNALFSVNYGFISTGPSMEAYERFSLSSTEPRRCGSLYDLHFILSDGPGGWKISCEYSSELFEVATVSRMLNHFVNLLRAAVARPGQRVSTMSMLGEAERQELIFSLNPADIGYPKHLTVPRLFEIQAKRTPDAIAVTCGDQSLSYGALDLASNRVAHELQKNGAGKGGHVGIFLERSLNLVVAMMAALKSGASYIPLDPGYPLARLAHILDDARPAVLLTTSALGGLLPEGSRAIPVVDVESPAVLNQRDTPVDHAAVADDVAYVIYTSGSTGRPKGVQIQHGALTNLLWAMRARPGFTDLDTLVSVTTVSFDISVMDFLMPLVVGARLVVAKQAEASDGSALLDLLRRQQATVMQATPATWQLLLEAGWQADPPIKVLCGGEAMSRALADQLLKAAGGPREDQLPAPPAEVWNMYGPTEATVWASALRVEPGLGPVSIGTPIANTQFHVLDPQGQLAPTGGAGELFIGGDGLALGYLNLPDMNLERFVPDHIRGKPQGRLYRTGDLVRRRSGGEIEFLGRSDHQIKLRGFRVELGEIESVLHAHPQVADCVVVTAANGTGELVIRAYVVQASPSAGLERRDSKELEAVLRDSLRQALPTYMCPSHISVLEALPRTPNGKVDRAALPDSAVLSHAVAQPVTPPGPTEARLIRIWSGVLGVTELGVHDNFFEVGGHSLLAVRLLARVEAEMGRKLPLATLFRNPTISGQAALLEQEDERAFDFRQVVRLQPNGHRPPIIAINNTGIYYLLSKRLGADQPFTSLQLFDPTLPQAQLPETIEAIAAEYVQLILRVQGDGPYSLLGWCVAGTLAFEVARQLDASGRQVSQLVLFDAWAPGHLRRLTWGKSLLADYSFRWKLIMADWRRTTPGLKGLWQFLENRTIIRKLRRWFVPIDEGDLPLKIPAGSPEQHDRWLLGYLENAAASYQPGIYPGGMTLFRSAREPSGRFIDPRMGWSAFVAGGVKLLVVEGDHFSIFQDPSVAKLAQGITAGIDSGRPAAG